MRSKLALLAAAVLCFAFLAPISGAWPLPAEKTAPTPSPAPTKTPLVATAALHHLPAEVAPVSAVTPSPTPSAPAAPDPIPEEPAEAVPVVATTTIGSSQLIKNQSSQDVDPAALLAEPWSLSGGGNGPQVLIVHTHTTEAYHPVPGAEYESQGDHRCTKPEYNMLRVGEALKAALEARGISVIHDQGLYDYPSYNGSYGRSAEAITRHLNEHPGISLVLDLHRDALGSEELIYKTLANGTPEATAQLMFVVGTNDSLDHPNWQENLRLALHLQQAVQARYPSLMRPIHLTGYRYNQQLSPGALILEVGTSGNSMAEALNAVELFAECVAPLLSAPRTGT